MKISSTFNMEETTATEFNATHGDPDKYYHCEDLTDKYCHFEIKKYLHKYNPKLYDKIAAEVSGFNPLKKYEKQRKFDFGGTSEVFRGIELSTRKDVAIKVMPIKPECGLTMKPRMYREIQNMKSYPHPNIAQYLDSYLLKDSLWIVMEFIDGITLSDLVRDHQVLPQDLAIILYNILQALEHLHKNGVMHRDIKPDNIIISKNGLVKLTDFGYSTQINSKLEPQIGTCWYMAPELIKSTRYDQSIDIWGLGISLIEMIDGVCPYANEDSPEVLEMIIKNGVPSLANEDETDKVVKDFLGHCLKVDPQLRYTASELLDHNLMKLVPHDTSQKLANLVTIALKTDRKITPAKLITTKSDGKSNCCILM